MFADGMPQYWAIYQVDLRKPSSAPMLNNPIAVLSIESDAKWIAHSLGKQYRGLTYVLTSHENGREDYSELY